MDEQTVDKGALAVIAKGLALTPALRRGLGLTVLFAFLGTGTRVAVPVLIQQVIDRGIGRGEVNVGLVAGLCASFAIVVVVAGVCLRTAIKRLGQRSEDALYGLRVRLFEHIHGLSIAYHNEEKRGALVARVTSDIETLGQFFSWGALAWILDGTLIVVIASIMLAYDWLLAMVAFAIAAPLVFAFRRVQRKLVRSYDNARGLNAEYFGAAGEFIAGAETLVAYGKRDWYARNLLETMRRRYRAQIRAGVLGALLFPVGELFSVLTVVGVSVTAIVRGPASGLTLGAVVGFIFLTYRFLEPVAEFTEIIDNTQAAVAGLRRIIDVLETPVGPPEPIDPIRIPWGTWTSFLKTYGSPTHRAPARETKGVPIPSC